MSKNVLLSSRIDGSRDEWWAGLRAPIVVAPMYRVTTARLVLEAGAAGAVAVLPAHNLASSADFDSVLFDMALAIRAFGPGQFAPWGINLIAHASNPRFVDDLAIVASHRCPLVITSIGSPRPVMEAVRAYGGRVWCDVISIEHARKAAAAGVDGLVLVCAGAGGNTGWINPLAFLKEVRRFYTGVVAVAGAITDGAQAYALKLLGADLAYIGTPFIATDESAAADDYKDAVANGSLDDVILSKAASGVPANLMTASLKRLGLDPADAPSLNVGSWSESAAWSAGHGIASAGQRQSARQLVEQLIREYAAVSSSVDPVQ